LSTLYVLLLCQWHGCVFQEMKQDKTEKWRRKLLCEVSLFVTVSDIGQ